MAKTTGSAASWYGEELGWPVAGTDPPRLATGVRFDVLDVPARAGAEALRRLPATATGPVAWHGRRMMLLVAPGGAEDLPGLLDWLQWGGVALDLVALGRGDSMPAPAVPGAAHGPSEPVWLRPPAAERGGAGPLPSLPEPNFPAPGPHVSGGPAAGPRNAALPGPRDGSAAPEVREAGGGAPDLARLVGALATACHRTRLFPPSVRRTARDRQAWAFS